MRANHFERGAKINLSFLLGFFVVLPLALGTFGFIFFSCVDLVRADACLDRGGSYNYETEQCDFVESHPGPR